MPMPSAEDVNATRLSRFDDAITEALESERLEFFREVVAHYVNEYDVPEVDVAAALALKLQGDEPMLLDPAAEPSAGGFADRGADRGDRPDRSDRADRGGQRQYGDAPQRPERRGSAPLATYRIAVGKRHRVEPRQIVGALANEGGLSRGDFGHIDIRLDHSLIELPATLPKAVWDALRSTRISGKLIELTPEPGQRGGGGKKPYRKKPRD
jgi:ATP-dependent RNA helicase DeaD